MKILVVYDSIYGNTGKIAESIGEGAGKSSEVSIMRAGQSDHSMVENTDLLFVGSPTHGGRPTEAIQKFINSIPENGLKNVYVTAFDTRFSYKDQNFGLKILMKAIGYAADKELKALSGKGGRTAAPAEGFIVLDKEGPLREGELERARSWAENIINSIIREREVEGKIPT